MNFKIIFAFLLFNFIQISLISCANDMAFIEEITELNFTKGKKNQDGSDELHCENVNNLDGNELKNAEEFCNKYGPTFVKCVNPDRKKTFSVFKCTGTFPNPNYSMKNYEIDCLESNERSDYYYVRTCILKYHLQKGKPKDEEKTNKNWFRNNLGYILGTIAGVCVAILIAAAVFMQCRKRDNEGSDL